MTLWLRDHPFGTALAVFVIASALWLALVAGWPWQCAVIVLAIVSYAWLRSLPWERDPGDEEPKL